MAPWTANKIIRRLSKWSIWLIIAFATGGAWIFYFADAPALARQFISGEAPFVAYATVGILTATTFILGGFLREQFCIYMCPWPRIQSTMMDENSLIVTYKEWRGEPRGSLKQVKNDPENFGRSEEHTSELQSRENLVCRLLLEKKKKSVRYM